MKTSRPQLNEAEVAVILTGLEAIVNILASARLGHFPRLDPRVQFTSIHGSSVYAPAEFDETMAGYMLSARNKLKWITASRKVRLNSFELAPCAYAFPTVRKEKLAPVEILAKVPELAAKLERYRKQAKRAAIKQIGGDAYGDQTACWCRFLKYVHSILCFRPDQWKTSALRYIHRDRREMMLARATEVAPTADPPLTLYSRVPNALRTHVLIRKLLRLGCLQVHACALPVDQYDARIQQLLAGAIVMLEAMERSKWQNKLHGLRV
jgi:hypothetical protein